MRNILNLSIILLLSITLLLIGMSCSSTRQTQRGDTLKLENEKSSFSLDFSRAPEAGALFIANPKLFSIAERELTVEAWIKKKRGADLNGSILTRLSGGGVSLYVKDNEPKFSISVHRGATSTFTAASGFKINTDTWTHIAGVLVNQDHSAIAGHPECPGGLHPQGISGGEAEAPHIDIYIKGIPYACASTWDSDNPLFKKPQFTSNDRINGEGLKQIFIGMFPLLFGGSDVDGLNDKTQFNAIIKEVRFWSIARTEAQIQKCMKQSLSSSGLCKIDPQILKAYWPLHEGSGTVANDLSGNGLAGSIFSPFGIKWADGWVNDSPF